MTSAAIAARRVAHRADAHRHRTSVAIVDDNAGFRPESSAAHEPNDAPDERVPDGEVSSIKSLARSSDEPSSSSFHANSPARKLAFSPRYHVSADSNAGAALFVRATRMSFTAAKSAVFRSVSEKFRPFGGAFCAARRHARTSSARPAEAPAEPAAGRSVVSQNVRASSNESTSHASLFASSVMPRLSAIRAAIARRIREAAPGPTRDESNSAANPTPSAPSESHVAALSASARTPRDASDVAADRIRFASGSRWTRSRASNSPADANAACAKRASPTAAATRHAAARSAGGPRSSAALATATTEARVSPLAPRPGRRSDHAAARATAPATPALASAATRPSAAESAALRDWDGLEEPVVPDDARGEGGLCASGPADPFPFGSSNDARGDEFGDDEL